MTDKEKKEIECILDCVFLQIKDGPLDSAWDVYNEFEKQIKSYIDSMQEEQEHFLEDAPATDYEVPKIEAWLAREDETDTQLGYLYLYLHKPIRAEDVGQWIGHNGVIVWNEGKYKALKWEDEPLKVSLSILGDKPKKCMFTKDNFTEEDRKILCEDCEEKCEYAKREEPVGKVWHDASERPDFNVGKTVVVGYNDDDDLYDECNNVAYYITLSIFVSRKDLNTKVVRWAYLKDLI